MPEVEQETLYECPRCGEEWRSEGEAEECCPSHDCPECGTPYHDEDEAYECCRYACEGCGSRFDYLSDAEECCRPSGGSDYVPALPDVPAYDVSIPALPDRPARLCSLEQELASGGAAVARLVYDLGYARDPYLVGYHSSGVAGRIRVEEDGSLPSEGGEVVYDRFDLSDPGMAGVMSRTLTKIRQLRDYQSSPRLVGTSYAAGIHVHISARDVNGRCMSPRDMAALHELWSYAECALYALSAAGWQRHRQPTDRYGGYCKAVPKVEGRTTPTKVWRAMRADRYYGLNFQRLFEASGRCSCGAAQMGDWDDCSCGAMDRATVEFRVFNTSTLPRTIHAFLILAHAMVAHAERHEIGSLEVNEYGSQTVAERRRVLDHLLEVLPLTDGERDVIRNAADRAPGL